MKLLESVLLLARVCRCIAHHVVCKLSSRAVLHRTTVSLSVKCHCGAALQILIQGMAIHMQQCKTLETVTWCGPDPNDTQGFGRQNIP
jgi:hypothetical protein